VRGLSFEGSEIKVTVKFFATLRGILGKREEQLLLPPRSTLKDALEALSRKYGSQFTSYVFEKGELNSFLQILINGRNATLLQRMATPLKNEDTIAILPPAGGG